MNGEGGNPWRGRIVLLTLAHVVGTVGYVSVMTMAPAIRTELDLNATQVGSFISAFYFAQALTAPPGGALADRLGVGTTLVAAMALLTTGAAVFAGVATYPPAVAAAFVMGLGYALVNPATAKGVLTWFKPEHRATAMGVKQMGVPMGGLLASALGAAVVFVSWRHMLWGIALVTVVVGLFWWRQAERPAPGQGGFRSLLADMKAVYTSRQLAALNAASATFNAGQQGFSSYLTLFLRDVAGTSQPFAGLCMGVAQSAGAIGRVLWAFVSDRYTGGRRKGVFIAILAGAVAGMAAIAMASAAWPAAALLASAFLLGATLLAYAALMHTLCAEAVPPKLAGAAIGANLLATSIGGSVGPILFGAIVDATGAYAPAWLATAGLVLAGVLLVGFGFREGRDGG